MRSQFKAASAVWEYWAHAGDFFMKTYWTLLSLILIHFTRAYAEVEVDVDEFGEGLGGWNARRGKAAEYEVSAAKYCTYRPEISPSPDGGIFVSVRIDHVRGFMASDDHASLELSFTEDGQLVTAQSSLALQGRTISSELIKGGASASTSVASPYVDRAVKIGTELVADLSSKLLREKIVEAGRVSFPAAIRHNYNLIYQAVKVRSKTAAPVSSGAASPASTPAAPPAAQVPPASNNETIKFPAPPPPAEKKPEKQPQEAIKPPAPAASSAASSSVVDPKTGKLVALPNIGAYNPYGTPAIPLPKGEKTLMREYGHDLLKLAKDVGKEAVKSR
jgi:hypothetical protein